MELLDAMIDDLGGNLFNIGPILHQVHVNFSGHSRLEFSAISSCDKDYIFHLAGQNDHVLSLQDPFPDIDINIKGSATLLEACRRYNCRTRLVLHGHTWRIRTRVKLPVSEDAPLNPKGIYELSSLTAQKLFTIFYNNHGIRSTTLRLTNIYGPRAQMKHNRFGVANWFVRQALDDETIKVFGDGKIMRDFLYVDDAVEAILMAACFEEACGEIFNVGVDKPSNFLELAQAVVRIAGSGRWEFADFTPERAAQEQAITTQT